MFIINITVNDDLCAEQHESLFKHHVEWFKRNFAAGKFVLLGPYLDSERAGVIIANLTDRDALMAVLREDVYFPDKASYEIREFAASMAASHFNPR